MVIRKVMLVDDEPDIRRIGQLALTRLGPWTVVPVGSGQEALETALREKPDVILLDVMMPLLDGPGTLQRLRGNPETAGIPVIFMTAKVQDDEVAHYLELGVAGVITKPFDPIALPRQVRRLVGEPEPAP